MPVAAHTVAALALAEAAFETVETDAAAAREMAERALRAARTDGDREAEVAALHALSFAQHELGDPQAIRSIRRAVRAGESSGLTTRTSLARRRLALDLAGRGSISEAERELERAWAGLDARERARTEVFRIAILWYAGRALDQSARTDRALAFLREHGDEYWEAQLLRNRGGLAAERGDTVLARDDLTRAHELFLALGATSAALAMEVELARVALLRGDLPECLSRLDAIDMDAIGTANAAELLLLRAQAAATARLRAEALQALREADAIWTRSQRQDHEGRLEVIRLTLLAGDPVGAHRLASSARRSFAAQHRSVHAARATGLQLAAAITAGALGKSSLRSGERAVTTLAAAGFTADARRVRLSLARAAIELGSEQTAARALAASAVLKRRGPIGDRIEMWHAEAVLRSTRGDRAGALRAAGRGLQLLEEYRDTLGASELRATASEIGVELAELGLRIALAGRNANAMLTWAERVRACALRLAQVTPPEDLELRESEIALRRVSAELQRARHAGRVAGGLATRQAELEATIRQISRHAAGGAGRATLDARRSELAGALAGRVLVELVQLDGELTALTIVDGRLDRVSLGAAAPVDEQLQWLRFALSRLAHGGQTAAQRAALLGGASASALALDRLLIGPIATKIADRGLVIVPTGRVHEVPWAGLPSLRGRPIVVAPSAATWLNLHHPGEHRVGGRLALVAGPRLRHARSEVEAIGGTARG